MVSLMQEVERLKQMIKDHEMTFDTLAQTMAAAVVSAFQRQI